MKNSIFIGLFALGTVALYRIIGVPHETLPEFETTVTLEDIKESQQVLAQEAKKEIKVKYLNLTKETLTFLTSEVNGASVDMVINDITKANHDKKKSIYLILDTPGGSVMDGARLMTAIEGSHIPVNCVDIGLSASMGFMILEHCQKRMGTPRATLMAHPASLQVMFAGELDKIVSRLSYMKTFVDKMDKKIAKRAGMPYEKFKLLSQQELWIDSLDAYQMGLLDEVVYVDLPAITVINPNSGSEKIKKDFKLE